METRIGVIGGSGVYEIDGLEGAATDLCSGPCHLDSAGGARDSPSSGHLGRFVGGWYVGELDSFSAPASELDNAALAWGSAHVA